MNDNAGPLTKFLTGINNTLNIANKALPIVKEAKPIINTVNKTYKTFKNSGKDLSNMMKLMKVKNQIKKDMNNNTTTYNINKKELYNNLNNPTFFI